MKFNAFCFYIVLYKCKLKQKNGKKRQMLENIYKMLINYIFYPLR